MVDLHKVTKINYDKGSYNVVDALYISTGWMPHVPNIQEPPHHSLNLLVPKEWRFWQCSHYIIIYLLVNYSLTGIPLKDRLFYVSLDHLKIVIPLALESRLLSLLVCGHVLEKDLPGFTPAF